jgi:hypothetical protein
MYDMMRNAKRVTLEDITQRQWLIGGVDLLAMKRPDSFKYEATRERSVFVRKFYDYCRSNSDNFKTSWTEWTSQETQNLSPGESFLTQRAQR